MIECRGLTKRFGKHPAVDEVTFTVRPGHVTGFLGPNGAGKSTTMRMIVGLSRPTAGTATIGGRPYRDLAAPLCEVGAVLDADAAHPARRARDHLRALARSNRLPERRVDELLGVVGLSDAAGRRVGGFSLGMRQRLGLAAALLGDPGVLVLDEPVNGLDTDGIRWIRSLLRTLAAEGRTVLVSSHVMSEVELVADHVVVIADGRLLADTTIDAFVGHLAPGATYVRAADGTDLDRLLVERGARLEPGDAGGWVVHGADVATVGDVAADHGVALRELRAVRSSLEDVYTELVGATGAGPAGDEAVEVGR
ncbi:MAG: ABC transporter ATP-binding protein [Actinomycetota bacterium]|nr:ABC transporter ATP-binding protein [Actinomycetota bacterium]